MVECFCYLQDVNQRNWKICNVKMPHGLSDATKFIMDVNNIQSFVSVYDYKSKTVKSTRKSIHWNCVYKQQINTLIAFQRKLEIVKHYFTCFTSSRIFSFCSFIQRIDSDSGRLLQYNCYLNLKKQ